MKFPLTHYRDPRVVELMNKTDHRVLGIWALDCAGRVMKYSKDSRPKKALLELKKWIKTGEFHMAVIRKASLDSHAAARESKGPARSAARSAGQAVATAHVPIHSIGSAIYALQAIHIATHSEAKVEKERQWQYKHLIELRNNLRN
jgi:hypothetical protein